MREKGILKTNIIRTLSVILIILAILFLVFIGGFIQIMGNRESANQTSRVLLDQVIGIIDKNEKNEEDLIENLKDDYIVRANAVAYILENKPDALYSVEELQTIAGFMKVDEIHIFDQEGVICSGTVEKYYGLRIDSGEQVGYFKPMLKDKTLSMCQDMMPNTAEEKSMMYAMVWMRNGSCMVQVGIEPKRLMNEIKSNELSTVVKNMPMYDGISIVVADKDTGEIYGATYEELIGKTLKEVGLYKEISSNQDVKGFNTKIKGENVFCEMKEFGKYSVLAIQEEETINRGLFRSLCIVFVYLCMAVAFIVVVFWIMNSRVQKEKDERLNTQRRSMEELRQQLSIIESISKDYTDIIIIDFMNNKSTSLKINGKMKEYGDVLEDQGQPYALTWKYYINKYVLTEYAEELTKNVSQENVMAQLETKDEYVCNYCCKYSGVVCNFQVKFIKINDAENSKDFVIAAFRCIDDILEIQKKIDELKHQALVDELTGFYNRRAFEEDRATYSDIMCRDDFVFVSLDINGLKVTNDTLGHDAGDELLIGASECIKQCFGAYGKVYRIGGDEFAAAIFAQERTLENIKRDFEQTTLMWRGKKVESLNVSCGYVKTGEVSDMTFNDMICLADKRMYENKEAFYRKNGKRKKS